MIKAAACAVAASLVVAGCYGPDPNVTPSGRGKPRIAIEFPAEVDAGSVHDALLEVTNPGPGDMETVVVEFSLLGVGGGRDLPVALVGPSVDENDRAVADVEPEPRAVSPDGVRYVFAGLDEGASMTIRFSIRAPGEPGEAANSVIVSDGAELERSRGIPLRTAVTR